MERRKFSREFKLEAVKLVRERGVTVAQAARDLDLHVNVLRKYRSTGQQDGAHHLGAAHQARGIQSSGCSRGIGQGGPEVVGDGVGRRKVWRNSR